MTARTPPLWVRSRDPASHSSTENTRLGGRLEPFRLVQGPLNLWSHISAG